MAVGDAGAPVLDQDPVSAQRVAGLVALAELIVRQVGGRHVGDCHGLGDRARERSACDLVADRGGEEVRQTLVLVVVDLLGLEPGPVLLGHPLICKLLGGDAG